VRERSVVALGINAPHERDPPGTRQAAFRASSSRGAIAGTAATEPLALAVVVIVVAHQRLGSPWRGRA
jgi:hypothetical protein